MTEQRKKPAWLTGEPSEESPSRQAPTARTGPLAEDDTSQLLTADRVQSAAEETEAPTRTVPRVAMPEARAGGNSPRGLLDRLRENPAPLVIALLAPVVLVVLFLLLFGRGGDPVGDPGGIRRNPVDPFAGGPVSDTGVAFERMQQSGEQAALSGAGLEWSGSVSEKEDGGGQTVTLEGPTAAQLERGFDLANWDVEPGVYAVAQEDTGEVLHVTTQTLVPQEQDAAAHEITLGTIYAFEGGEFSGYAYYLDRREEESDRVTRTYVRPGRESYRVSYEAPATATSPGGDRNGAFVPLLVGWRGFEDARITRKEGE